MFLPTYSHDVDMESGIIKLVTMMMWKWTRMGELPFLAASSSQMISHSVNTSQSPLTSGHIKFINTPKVFVSYIHI